MEQYQVPDSLRSSALSIAKAAVDHFPWTTVSTTAGGYPLPVVMTVIAYAETTFGANKHGRGCAGPYSCNGITCAGAWQIGISPHADMLRSMTGSSSPCVWVNWLDDDENCAAVAKEILSSYGFRAWQTYTEGTYASYLSAATEMVSLARGEAYVQSPTPPPPAPTIRWTPPTQQPTHPLQRFVHRIAILESVPDWALIAGAGLVTAGVMGMVYVAVRAV